MNTIALCIEEVRQRRAELDTLIISLEDYARRYGAAPVAPAPPPPPESTVRPRRATARKASHASVKKPGQAAPTQEAVLAWAATQPHGFTTLEAVAALPGVGTPISIKSAVRKLGRRKALVVIEPGAGRKPGRYAPAQARPVAPPENGSVPPPKFRAGFKPPALRQAILAALTGANGPLDPKAILERVARRDPALVDTPDKISNLRVCLVDLFRDGEVTRTGSGSTARYSVSAPPAPSAREQAYQALRQTIHVPRDPDINEPQTHDP
jgi:hypothetical protein